VEEVFMAAILNRATRDVVGQWADSVGHRLHPWSDSRPGSARREAGSVPELPRGEVTFCFTDIEGSSALSGRLGEAQFAAIIERHRELLRDAWRPWGGVEVGTEGDGCFVVFADVDAALAACVRAQQRLAVEDWPAGAAVRVRMGVHTGHAVPTDAGDYIALAVNQAARVAACGHGGQVVVSAAAAELANDPPLRRLGRFRVRDFAEPVELFQAVGDGLELEFPPLRGAHSVDVIRVAIADDQALVRGGFAVLLRGADDIEVVGEAADGAAAVELAVRERPDVVLMDVRMPVMDGVEATRRITTDERLSSTRVVILTTFDLDEYVFDALRAGASGFLLKDTLPADLLAAVRVVAGGEALLAPSVTRRLVEEYLRRPAPVTTLSPALAQLTPRETEVLAAVARGLSNREIATTLFMSHATAKTHVSRLLTKLHARDRAQLVMLAYEAGVVAPGGR
jgi:DNA-binding NarL/FixJ family response regulator/class 3 adenylate cyclase